jgi:Predicted proteasome-type protease
MPLDLLVYREGSLEVPRGIASRKATRIFEGIRNQWGAGLRQLLGELPAPPGDYWH